MTTTVIPADFTVVVNGVAVSNADDWNFSDSDFQALQWDDVSQTGEIELFSDDNIVITDYITEVYPYDQWHARQLSLQASAAACDYRFYTLGDIDDSTNTYNKIPRDFSTCQDEQEIEVIRQAEEKLSDTDLFYVRSVELSTSVPADIETYRAEVRDTRDQRLSAIQATTTVEELETLVVGFDNFTVKNFGYTTLTSQYNLTQPEVNGTHPWPRISYTRLRES